MNNIWSILLQHDWLNYLQGIVLAESSSRKVALQMPAVAHQLFLAGSSVAFRSSASNLNTTVF